MDMVQQHDAVALLRDAIRDVAEAKYNLVIGTQLVAKGHHFPHLTLVGVVDADLALARLSVYR